MDNLMIKREGPILMSETPLYVARASVDKIDGLHRRGVLEDGTKLEFGVHGPIKAHYGLESQPDLPLPVDYLVAAAAG
jgi:hypothetical protein